MEKPNNQKHIRERREKVLMFLAKGYNQTEIAKELGTTKQTTSNDMKAINEISNHGLFDLAKATLPTMYLSCIETVNQSLRAAWNVHDNTVDDKVKIMAINIIRKCGETKFSLFQGGPAMMEVNRLTDEVKKIKDNTFSEDHIYEEGEVVMKEGRSPYVYHSPDYLRKHKLGILTEEEKREAEERTKDYWQRFDEDKKKEWNK